MSLKGSATNIRRKSAIEMTLLKCQKAEFKVINNFKSGCSLFTRFKNFSNRNTPQFQSKSILRGFWPGHKVDNLTDCRGLDRAFWPSKPELCVSLGSRDMKFQAVLSE